MERPGTTPRVRGSGTPYLVRPDRGDSYGVETSGDIFSDYERRFIKVKNGEDPRTSLRRGSEDGTTGCKTVHLEDPTRTQYTVSVKGNRYP